jgi:hypothetical protein
LTFETKNRWINATISKDDRQINFAHELASELTMQSLNDAENGEYAVLDDKAVIESEKGKKRLSNPEIVPTIYRFGLP